MRRMIWIACSIIAVAGIVFGIGHQPTRVSAGGFPCFVCHGVNFEGSDIAPAIAGTKLTDEQIANQMRHPRGVMPAFGPNDWPDPQTAISYIRAQPTGKPTLALSPQQKSAALATIAAVAGTRSAEYARLSGSVAIETPTPAPRTPTSALSPTPIAGAAPRDSSFGFSVMVMVGGLLAASVGIFWFGRSLK